MIEDVCGQNQFFSHLIRLYPPAPPRPHPRALGSSPRYRPVAPTYSSYSPARPTWIAGVSRRTRCSRLVAMKKRRMEAGGVARDAEARNPFLLAPAGGELPSCGSAHGDRPHQDLPTQTCWPRSTITSSRTCHHHHPGPGSARALGSTATPVAAARPWRRARVLAKLGREQHGQHQLHHTAPDVTLHDQLTEAINAQKTWLTGSVPVSVQRLAEEEEDRELGAPVMDSTRERIKWVSGV